MVISEVMANMVGVLWNVYCKDRIVVKWHIGSQIALSQISEIKA